MKHLILSKLLLFNKMGILEDQRRGITQQVPERQSEKKYNRVKKEKIHILSYLKGFHVQLLCKIQCISIYGNFKVCTLFS
jgi:hypothetical protein